MSTRATVKNFQNTDNLFACATLLFWLIKFSRYTDTARWRFLLVLKMFYWLFSIGKIGWSTVVQMVSENPQCKISIRIGVYHLHSPYWMTSDKHQSWSRAWNWWKQIFPIGNFGPDYMANFIPGWNFSPASETNPFKIKLSITWRGIRCFHTGLGFSVRPNGLKNPCNRYNFIHPGPKKEREHAHRLCFRTSVNFLMEICVLRPGWNWARNHNNISARAETYHVIRLLDVSKILEILEHRNSSTIYIPTEISETFWLMVNNHCDL